MDSQYAIFYSLDYNLNIIITTYFYCLNASFGHSFRLVPVSFQYAFIKKKKQNWAVPGGPLVKNPPSNQWDKASIPGCGTKIPHAAEPLSPHTTIKKPECSRAHALQQAKPMPQLEKACVPQ